MIVNATTGSALNYRVVGGTTEPETPMNNTIWVPTDVDIPKHEFSVSDLHTGYKDTDLLEGQNLVNGYLDSAGAVVEPNADTPEVYTEAYIPVNYEKTYTFNYQTSETKTMWLAVVEYKENNVFSKHTVLVNKVSAKEKTGTYTPSGKNVVAVRLTWRTFPNVETTVTFVGPNAKYTIEEPEEGTVWFLTGTKSPVAFNALRRNRMWLYPLGVRQYANGEWVEKTAKSYQNGAWVDWYKDIIVYDGGAKDIALTYTLATDKGSYVTLSLGSDSSVATMKTEAVNLTGLKKLEVKYSNRTGDGELDTYFCAVVWDEAGTKEVLKSKAGTTATSGTLTVDISDLSGMYCIGFRAENYGSGSGTVRCNSIKALTESSAAAAAEEE